MFRQIIDSGMSRGLTPAMLAECTMEQIVVMAASIETLKSLGKVQTMSLESAVRAGVVAPSPGGLSKAGRMRKAAAERRLAQGRLTAKEERRKRREAVRKKRGQ